jgi:hypothetical protein
MGIKEILERELDLFNPMNILGLNCSSEMLKELKDYRIDILCKLINLEEAKVISPPNQDY